MFCLGLVGAVGFWRVVLSFCISFFFFVFCDFLFEGLFEECLYFLVFWLLGFCMGFVRVRLKNVSANACLRARKGFMLSLSVGNKRKAY